MGTKRLEREVYWRGVLRRQQRSGQSVRQFCRKSQLSEPSFYSWRKKLGNQSDKTVKEQTGSSSDSHDQSCPGGDGRATHSAHSADSVPVFIPLRLEAPSPSMLEVVHPRGHVLRIPALFDEASLQRVLQLLDRVPQEVQNGG